MSDTFVILNHIKHHLANCAVESFVYKNDFFMKDTVKCLVENYKDKIDFEELTPSEAKALNFYLPEEHTDVFYKNYLYVLPVWTFPFLPASGELWVYPGQVTPKAIKYNNKEELSLDSRGGYLAYGIFLFEKNTERLLMDDEQSRRYKNVCFVNPKSENFIKGFVYLTRLGYTKYDEGVMSTLKETFKPGPNDPELPYTIEAWIPSL